MKNIEVIIATSAHMVYAQVISKMIEDAAKARGTGIALRHPSYIAKKMEEGKAVIALYGERAVGFCYIETWEHEKYVANSGLVVDPDFREFGLAKTIKKTIFNLSRTKYPEAKIFGITTSPAVMKINTELGYKPVAFSELTIDEEFWKGCRSCPNHDILERTQRKYCLCTGMLVSVGKEERKSKRVLSTNKENLDLKDEKESCVSV